MDGRHHLPAGSAAEGPYETAITPESAGWARSGLSVVRLPPGGVHAFDTGPAETLVVPLAGSCAVECDGRRFDLRGRPGVFAGVTDFAYAPREAAVTVASADGGRFALASARCDRRMAARYGPAARVGVELRGAGRASRQVNNLCTPATFAADRLIACEVLTPGGNWSSYPPHKHDTRSENERELEEIYYFEVAGGPTAPGFAWMRLAAFEAARPIELSAEVRSGDAVLVPHGWHGPAAAAPGYDLYYLNVMAGPGPDRAWLVTDHPDHAWIRGTWDGQEPDPRLPMRAAGIAGEPDER